MAYGSKWRADKARFGVRDHHGEVLRPYYCKFCGAWHLGHIEDREKVKPPEPPRFIWWLWLDEEEGAA